MGLAKQVRILASGYLIDSKYVTMDLDKIDELAVTILKCGNQSREMVDLNYTLILKELVANSINYCYWYGRHDIKPGGGAGDMYQIVNDSFERYNNDLSKSIARIIRHLSIRRFPLLEQRKQHLLEVEDLGENFVDYMVTRYKNDSIFEELVETFHGYASDIFLKRASLFFLQLYRVGGWYRYIVENLFVPADYQVPKMLEHFGCINYSIELKRMILTSQLIPTHSLQEIEIRSATIHVCDLLVQKTGRNISDIDWWLWSQRHLCNNPFHLTETTDY